MEPKRIEPQPQQPAQVVTPEAQPSTPAPLPGSSAPSQVMSPKGKGGKIFAIVLIVIIVLGAAGYLGYKYWYKKPKKASVTAVAVKKDIPSLVYNDVAGTFDTAYPADNSINSGTDSEANAQIFEGLVQYQNGTKIVPLLANSWSNPNDKTWVFNLKSGVKFHDGATMSADDVKYSLELAQKNDSFSNFTDSLNTITVINPQKIQITTKTTDPTLLGKLSYLYILDAKGDPAKPYSRGTGPYILKDGTTPAPTKLELSAYDKYHGGHIYTRNLTFIAKPTDDPDQEEVNAVKGAKAGTYNIAGFIGDTNLTKEDTSKLTKIEIKDLAVRLIGINVLRTASPLSKLKVRQALYMAINPQKVMKAGDAQTTGIVATQSVTAEVPGYNPTIKPPANNITAAKALLTEAGYPSGFSFTLSVGAGIKDVGDEVAAQLKEVGVTAKLDVRDDYNAFGSDVFGGKTESYLLGYSPNILDASDTFATLFQGPNYENPQVNTLMTQASNTLDASKRLKNLQDISKIVMNDVAAIPLYSRKDTYVMDKKYVVTQDNYGYDIGVYFYKVYTQ